MCSAQLRNKGKNDLSISIQGSLDYPQTLLCRKETLQWDTVLSLLSKSHSLHSRKAQPWSPACPGPLPEPLLPQQGPVIYPQSSTISPVPGCDPQGCSSPPASYPFRGMPQPAAVILPSTPTGVGCGELPYLLEKISSQAEWPLGQGLASHLPSAHFPTYILFSGALGQPL